MSLDHAGLHALEHSLAARPPRRIDSASEGVEQGADEDFAQASVALVVRPAGGDLELLVIRRATREGDPWSGHMAFPGGRRDPDDRSAQETAERETREEVGIDLARQGRLLGRLEDVGPRAGPIPIIISPFVFAADRGVAVEPNHEVDAAFWVPIPALTAPGAAIEYLHVLAHGEELRFPAIAYQSDVIWGLTHQIMTDFLRYAAGTPPR